MLGNNQNSQVETQTEQTETFLGQSFLVSFTLEAELQIHSSEGQLLDTEAVLSKLKSNRKLNREIAIVWLPTQKVVMTEVLVPGKRKAHWLAALPFTLEEGLSEPIESYHFVPYHRTSEGVVSVAIVSHEDMIQWQRILESHGLVHVQLVPDCFRLENLNGDLAENSLHWSLYQQADQVLVRTSAYQGFSTHDSWYDALKEHVLSRRLLLVEENTNGIEESWLESKTLLSSHAQNLAAVRGLSLSQLGYKTQASDERQWYEWRWVAMLLLIISGVFLTSQIFQTQQINDEVAYTKQKNIELFKTLFPEVKRIVNIKSQTLTYLKQQAGSGDDSRYLMPILQTIEPWFNQVKTVKIEQLQWQKNKPKQIMVLTVSAPNSKDLEQIITLAKAQKSSQFVLSLTVKNVTADGAQGVIYVDAN